MNIMNKFLRKNPVSWLKNKKVQTVLMTEINKEKKEFYEKIRKEKEVFEKKQESEMNLFWEHIR